MPDPVAPAPGTPAAAPAAPVDRLQPSQGAAGTVAAAMAKARAAATAAPAIAPRVDPLSSPAAATPPAPATPAAPDKPKIDANPASVKQWASLARENRELQAKIKSLEPAAAEAATLATARKLYGEGKRIEAVALLANAKDATAEMESLMADYLKGGTPAEEITAAQLAKRLEDEKAAEKKTADEKAAKDEEARRASADAEVDKSARAFVAKVLDEPAMAAKFERCARAVNREEAAGEAVKQVAREAGRRGLAAADLTPEIARQLIEFAYEAIESDYDRQAAEATARFSKGPLQTQAPVAGSESSQRASANDWGRREKPEPGNQPTAPTIDASLSRPGVVPQPPRRFYSHAEAAERAREAARKA